MESEGGIVSAIFFFDLSSFKVNKPPTNFVFEWNAFEKAVNMFGSLESGSVLFTDNNQDLENGDYSDSSTRPMNGIVEYSDDPPFHVYNYTHEAYNPSPVTPLITVEIPTSTIQENHIPHAEEHYHPTCVESPPVATPNNQLAIRPSRRPVGRPKGSRNKRTLDQLEGDDDDEVAQQPKKQATKRTERKPSAVYEEVKVISESLIKAEFDDMFFLQMVRYYQVRQKSVFVLSIPPNATRVPIFDIGHLICFTVPGRILKKVGIRSVTTGVTYGYPREWGMAICEMNSVGMKPEDASFFTELYSKDSFYKHITVNGKVTLRSVAESAWKYEGTDANYKKLLLQHYDFDNLEGDGNETVDMSVLPNDRVVSMLHTRLQMLIQEREALMALNTKLTEKLDKYESRGTFTDAGNRYN